MQDKPCFSLPIVSTGNKTVDADHLPFTQGRSLVRELFACGNHHYPTKGLSFQPRLFLAGAVL